MSLEENSDIFLVKYYINFDKSGDEKFIWLSLCTPNFYYHKEIKDLKTNLLQVFYFLEPKYYLSYKEQISYSKNLGLSESKIHKIICEEFNKNKLKSI